MKKPLLALLAVAAVAVVAVVVVVIIENTPERRMDRRFDKLLRTYDDPKQLYQRLVDDRDLLGLLVFSALRCGCGRQLCEVASLLYGWGESMNQLAKEICDCRANERVAIWNPKNRSVWGGHHSERCEYWQTFEGVEKRWGPYMERKRKEIREKAELRLEFHTEAIFDPLRPFWQSVSVPLKLSHKEEAE